MVLTWVKMKMQEGSGYSKLGRIALFLGRDPHHDLVIIDQRYSASPHVSFYLSSPDVFKTSDGLPICFTIPSCKTTICLPSRFASAVLCVT